MSTKLLYIANIRLPTEKAHGIQIMKMCEAFAREEARVELVVPWRFNAIKEDPFVYYNVEKKFTITRIPSFDLIAFGKIGFLLQVVSFAFFAFFYAIISGAQIIYVRDEMPLFFLSFFKKNIFWETHTTKENFFALRLLHRASGIIAITGGLKDFYITKGGVPKKILVAHDSVDVKQFDTEKNKSQIRAQFGLGMDRQIVSYVGKYKTMGEPKGVDDMILSFPDVLFSAPSAFLLLVGINKDEVEEVKVVCKDAHIAERNYKIITHVPQRDAFLYMKASDVLVMNYPDTPHYSLYMSPLKLFEYMASGVPIISSDLPSIREVLNDESALLVKTAQSCDLSSGILKLLEDKHFSATLAKRARESVEGYTWERRAKRIFEFMHFQDNNNL